MRAITFCFADFFPELGGSFASKHPVEIITFRSEIAHFVGEQFAALECPKLYYWSDGDPPGYRSSFIADAALPNRQYPGDSHWPMIDQPERCSSDIADFFTEAVGTAM